MASEQSEDWSLRVMTEADAENVATLCGELDYPSTTSEIRERFRAIASSDLLIVAVDSANVPGGFIHASITRSIEAAPRAHVLGLVVSSRVRRRGVARRLITEVERWAASLRVSTVVVRSNTARGEAHEFYPAAGYVKIKTQAVYLKQLA